MSIIGKTNRLVNQESRESYGDKTAEGDTSISQGDDEFIGAENKFVAARAEQNVFDAAHAEESETRACSQRAGNLAKRATGKANKREEDEADGNAAGNHTQSTRNPVEQATGEVKTIFGGGHGWGNEIAPKLDPHTLGITGGAAGRLTQQAKKLPAGGNAPRAGKTAHDLHRALMGVNRTLHSTVVGGNRMGGATGTVSAPAAGQHQCVGRGSTGWYALTEAVKMFGPAATTQEFSKNY